MSALILAAAQQILVISSIWGQIDRLATVETITSQYDWIILNGGGCYSYQLALDNIQKLDHLYQLGKFVYTLDDMDLLLSSRINLTDQKHLQIEKWIHSKPNIVRVNFPNGFSVNIVNGGIPNLLTEEQLKDNLEVSFVCDDWHQTYSGGLGYVVSNYPKVKDKPQFHRYSAQIGHRQHIYALKINQYGVQETIIW